MNHSQDNQQRTNTGSNEVNKSIASCFELSQHGPTDAKDVRCCEKIKENAATKSNWGCWLLFHVIHPYCLFQIVTLVFIIFDQISLILPAATTPLMAVQNC